MRKKIKLFRYSKSIHARTVIIKTRRRQIKIQKNMCNLNWARRNNETIKEREKRIKKTVRVQNSLKYETER